MQAHARAPLAGHGHGPPHHHQQQQGLDDLVQSLNLDVAEWRNIQDVVRITFKAFHDVLRQQGEQIKALERTVDQKAGRAEVSVALQQKANASEVAARLAELEMVVHKKADVVDMDRRALKTELDASLRTQMADVFTILNTKSEAVETRAWRESSERQLASMAAEVSRHQQGLEEVKAQLHTKASVMEVGQALAMKADVSEVEDKLRDKPSRRQVADALALKADLAGVDLTLSQMRQEISDLNVGVSRRAEVGRVEEVSQRLERLRQRVEADSDTTAAALRSVSSAFDEALLAVQQRAAAAEKAFAAEQQATAEQLEQRLHVRLDEQVSVLRNMVERKAETVDVQAWLAEKCDLDEVAEELEARAMREDVDALSQRLTELEELRRALDSLGARVEGSAADVRVLRSAVDNKAEVDDVNTALLDVCGELERRASLAAVDALAREQVVLAGSLAQRGAIARWMWRSGITKGGGAVPWNVQTVNTDPANFLWEADKTVVMAMAPGMYRVELGFYCKQKPIVQLLVDGEPVITLVNTSNARMLHQRATQPRATTGNAPVAPGLGPRPRFTASAGGYGGRGFEDPAGVAGMDDMGSGEEEASALMGMPLAVAHTSTNITGATCTEFLCLNGRAKLAVTFQGGDLRAEGFLGLQRL